MLRRLPPVGNPILVKEECLDSDALRGVFPGWNAHYLASGAMALAAALKALFTEVETSKHEVLLPAYSCPELVSATLFAGGSPVLVDLEKDRPWMSLESLKNKITPNTAAIVTVDLLGIPERIDQIRNVIGEKDILVIEDSAQYMPRTPGHDSWSGDIVVLSFGRGKPVSLLGGGAILTRVEDSRTYIKQLPSLIGTSSKISRFKAKMRCLIYNLLMNPMLYWIPSSLPFLHLGATRFKKLNSINPIDPGVVCLLSKNLRLYSKRTGNMARLLHNALKEIAHEEVVDLGYVTATKIENLLRYPILIKNSRMRMRFLDQANHLGLGATTLYGTNLTGVDGIGREIRGVKGLPNSTAFAEELITLPVHSAVSIRDIAEIINLLKSLDA